MESRKLFEHNVLRQVGILKLIHQHMSEAPRVFFCHQRVFLQECGGVKQQVVKIHCVVER